MMNAKLKPYKRKLPINVSNSSIYEYINKRINSKDNIIEVIVDISEKIPFINIQETLDKTIKLVSEKKLITEVYAKSIKNEIKRYRLENSIATKIEAELFGFILFYIYQKEYYEQRTGKELIELEYKIHKKQIFHNKEQVQEEVIKGENEQRISEIEKLTLSEQKKEYLKLIKEFENHQFFNTTDAHKKYIKHFKKSVKRLKEEIKDSNINKNSASHPLEEIWLPQAKISIKDFLKKGIDKGIWNEEYTITTKRGSLYGTGKILLGSLSVALRNGVINNELDHKVIGEAFCSTFNIKINSNTEEKYKSFELGNPKYVQRFKSTFNIK